MKSLPHTHSHLRRNAAPILPTLKLAMKIPKILILVLFCLGCQSAGFAQALFTDATNTAVGMPKHSIIAVADVNNDGVDDLVVNAQKSGADSWETQIWKRQSSGFNYTNATAASGLQGLEAASAGDFNNDGFIDFLHINGNRTEAALYLNSGNGTFTKVALPQTESTALFGFQDSIRAVDIEGDGDLDLVFGKAAGSGGSIVAVLNQARNGGSTTQPFSGLTTLALTSWIHNKADVTDANGDGKADLLSIRTAGNWSSGTHPDFPVTLFLNTGNSTADYLNPNAIKSLAGFTQRDNCGISAANVMSPLASWDIDNDGDLDLINGSSDWPSVSRPHIYINDGSGNYTQSNSPVYQSTNYYHHGISIFDADLDNDMDAVWTALHNFANMYPRMWRNDGNLAFSDVTTTWGINVSIGSGNLGMSGYHADLDGDGDIDFVVDMNNGWGSEKIFRIFKNNAVQNGSNWLGIKLVSSTSAPNGIGARVEVTANGKKLTQYMADTTGGVRNLSALRFGLGSATKADSVKVYWPSGQVTEFNNVSGNQVLSISEVGNPLDSDGDGVNDYREQKDGTDPNNASSFDPLSKGLVAHYPFDGNAKDQSGRGYHGSNVGATLSADRFFKEEKSYSFNGNSKIDLPFPQGSVNEYTVTAWFKTTEGGIILGANHQEPALLIGIAKGASGSGENTGRSFFSLSANPGVWIGKLSSSKTQALDDQWHQIVGVFSSQTGDIVKPELFQLFIDGKEVDFRNNTSGNLHGSLTSPIFAQNLFSIGTHADGWEFPGFNGNLDDIRIYNRALSDAEVSQLYSKESENSNMVTVQGGTLPSGSGLAGQAVETFQISKFETTWGEWKAVRDWAVANGFSFDNNGSGTTNLHPVADVSWYDVVKWCNAKSEKEGLSPVYQVGGATYKTGLSAPTVNIAANGYRLPLEKEWEWAARGGVSSQGYTYSGSNDANAVAWTYENSSNGTKAVGTKSGNELGICDMSGNVWEWCWDGDSSYRKVRGGSVHDDKQWSPVAKPNVHPPNSTFNPDTGFRLARTATGDMVTVQGGTLPQGSELAGQKVGTFQIGKYEVTWGEWKTVRDWAVANGYTDLANIGQGSADNHPVGSVSWYDAVKWCNAKSEMEGLTPVYQTGGATYRTGQSAPTVNSVANGYRLPLEKEWEWAARGGLSSKGYTYSGSNDANAVAWHPGNSSGGTKAIGTKSGNELGIYDMSGNVWEWCWDIFGTYRRIRGGGWLSSVDGWTLKERGFGEIQGSSQNLGFRLARNASSPADTTAPVVAITSISANARLTSANATFGGTITETGSKPTLQYRLGTTGNWTSSTVGGSASPYSFSQLVALKPGLNTVQFQSKDDAENTSTLASVNVSYVVASTLTITAPNAADGSVTSGFGGSTSREVGVSYTVTATPASGMVFKEWLKNGVSTSTNATLTFTMQPGLTLKPVFVPDFAKLGGFYNGLVGVGAIGNGTSADMQAFAANNGFLQLTSGTNGALSGVLKIEGKSHSFNGTMGANKRATITVLRPGKGNATLSLSLVSALPGEISGSVTTSGAPLAFRALRAAYTAGAAKHALAGKRYAIVLPPPSGLAMGYGHATLTVEDNGAAVLSGVLANGQAVNAGARIVDDGAGNWVFPVYVGASGIFTGEIVIPKTTPASGSELGGSLEWLKPASNTGLFKSGFLKSLQPLGATHNATSAGLGGAAFSLTLDPAKRILSAAVVQTGTWANGAAPTLATPVKSGLTISFNPLSGKFEGSFTRTVNSAPLPTPIQGTLFSRPIPIPGGATLRGAGFFTSGNASTAVEVTTP